MADEVIRSPDQDLVHHVLTRAVEYLDAEAPYEATASRDFGRGYAHATRVLEHFRDYVTGG